MNLNQLFEEKNMGFFEDTKPPEPPPVIQEIKQDWLAVLIGGIFTLIGILMLAGFRSVAFIAKPVFQYLFTFEGRTREQITTQMGIAISLIGLPLFLLYQIPAVRDAVSLSTTHTINHSNGYRVFFPDRSYFVIDSERRGGIFDSRTYTSYAGYTDGTFQKIGRAECQMVPRGEKIRLGSEFPPTNAEGFKDEVGYVLQQRIGTLSGTDYLIEWVKHPKLWFNKLELEHTVVNIEKKSTWKRFIDEWNEIRKDNGDHRSFEVRARAREHAVICF